VAVLIDETSASASEVFAGGMQAIGRVRVFGSTSLGGVLPAVTDRLPNGDVLYHAIADFATPDGTVLEGRGVLPDEPVRPTRADLLAGRDPVLDAALAWIDTFTKE
jgi:carboxyl-terminal processing protease